MGTKYLAEFYTYHHDDLFGVAASRFVEEPDTAQAYRIQARVLHGNVLFHRGDYGGALPAYLEA